LARLGRYHEAGPLFAKASELDPRQVEPLFGYAEARQKDGDYKGALDTYQQTYERGGGVTSALGIARNFVFLGQLQEARTVLEKEAAAHPDNRDVHYELSRVYARLGEKALALEQTQIVQHLQAESEHPGSKTGFAQ
jgi:tetratricopeptide (TPR) repeat protein